VVPLYAARVSDLGPGDFVHVECVCGHSELILASGLQQGLRLPPFMPVLDLQYRLRCRECDRRGRVAVLIKWVASLMRSTADCVNLDFASSPPSGEMETTICCRPK
jgi:hypothetical protein